jgi:hypothetical protein
LDAYTFRFVIHDVLRAVLGPDAYPVADRCLRFVADKLKTDDVVLFEVRPGQRLAAFARLGSVEELTSIAAEVRRTAWASLEKGEIVRKGKIAVAPIRSDSQTIAPQTIALLGVEEAKSGTLAEMLPAIEQVLVSVIEAAGDDVNSRREHLLSALESNEWNISRVSRLMGVTRVTIYEWMNRYRIPRKKVRLGA